MLQLLGVTSVFVRHLACKQHPTPLKYYILGLGFCLRQEKRLLQFTFKVVYLIAINVVA